MLAAHPSHDEFVAHADGLLLAAGGDHAAAVVGLRAVLDAADEASARPPTCPARCSARSRVALATALLARGDRAGALVAVRRGGRRRPGQLARAGGSDRAEALLRRLEGSSVRSEGELTAREREVAALIAEGLTNGQLAERLFISPKTAAVHVSNILTKLGLSGRAEVAAWAVRHGVVLQSLLSRASAHEPVAFAEHPPEQDAEQQPSSPSAIG